MTDYYQTWLEANARINHLQLTLFLATLTGYMVYRWHFQTHFWLAAAVYGLVVAVAIGIGIWPR